MHHMESRYFLSKHVFMCIAQGYAVFLDVKRDKYSALTCTEALRIRDSIVGWPVTAPDSLYIDDSISEGERLLQELRHEGLITGEALAGKPASPVTLHQSESDLRHLVLGTSNVPVRHTVTFLAAWARITFALLTQSLEHSIERVRRRKSRSSQLDLPVDIDKVRPLIASYFELQPRFFSSYDTCLRNSLTLIEYLALNGMYPTWVFGVHMDPWAAHSWVQDGSAVLNDTTEHVRNFTPILTI